MAPVEKIILGALATSALAWFLHGPMGFGALCSAEAGRAAGAAMAPAAAIPGASAEQVASCQQGVDSAIAGKTVKFGSGGLQIAGESKPLLDAIAGSLKACAGTSVEVSGHTDRVGDAVKNMALSQARANAVKAALTARGVPADRLVARGYGETRPVDAAGPEKNAADRRIEFSVSAAGAVAPVAEPGANR